MTSTPAPGGQSILAFLPSPREASSDSGGFIFHGRHIVEVGEGGCDGLRVADDSSTHQAVVEDIISLWENLANLEQLVLMGGSAGDSTSLYNTSLGSHAGAFGVGFNCDLVADRFHQVNISPPTSPSLPYPYSRNYRNSPCPCPCPCSLLINLTISESQDSNCLPLSQTPSPSFMTLPPQNTHAHPHVLLPPLPMSMSQELPSLDVRCLADSGDFFPPHLSISPQCDTVEAMAQVS